MSELPFTLTIAGTSLTFKARAGETVLDAALHSGIELPYSCRKGVCGNCAGVVETGEVTPLGPCAIINEACLPDQVLFCACVPTSDLRLRPTGWTLNDDNGRKRIAVRVYRNTPVAPDIHVLELRLPAGRRARFRAGQYLEVLLADGSRRCFSMANPPRQSDALTLHVRIVPDGTFSSGVPALARGDMLEVELPFGNVELPASDTRPLILVAGGTGFAPVKAILDDLATRGATRPITLIWGARLGHGLYLGSAVERWRRAWPAFRYVPAVSEELVDLPGAYFGHVDQALQHHFTDLNDYLVYCCGAPAMVEAVRAMALSLKLRRQDFHADMFVPGPATGIETSGAKTPGAPGRMEAAAAP